MNKFFAITAIFIGFAACSLAACGQEVPQITKIADDEFLQKMSEGIKAYSAEQPNVKRLGWGTCRILLSGKPSKMKFTGQGEGVEVVPPIRKPLTQVVASEQKRKQSSKSVAVSWIAWSDHLGNINLAFNNKLGDYESSTVWEVTDLYGKEWRAWGTYSLEELNGFDREKKPWVRIDINNLGWVMFGQTPKEIKISEYLKALSDLRILSEVKIAE